MPRNLSDQATAQADRSKAVLVEAQQAFVDASAELTRRGDPSASPPEQWRTALGAEQYLEAAVARLEERRSAEAAMRQSVEDATPDDLEPLEEALRDALVELESARVLVRDATERLAQARAERERAATAVARATDRVAASTAWATEAEKLQASHDALRAAVDSGGELESVPAQAVALLGDDVVTRARDRLRELLPATLFDRAEARAAEARERQARAGAALEAGAEELDSVQASRFGIEGGAAAARRRVEVAEAALVRYVRRAGGGIDRATALLDPIPDLADLTASQATALDDDDAANDPAKVAAGHESALAAALRTLADRQRDVDAAILAALADDPDRDASTEGGVQAAEAARDDASVQDPLGDARSAYDTTARTTLSGWEVSVPPPVWVAARDYFVSVGELTELADGAARQDLVDALDAAVDALADALDAQAVARRSEDRVAAVVASRAAEVDALRQTAGARFFDYVRGAGPGGRTPSEV